MMNQYYPRLRRLSVSVDYEVREVLNSEAARLIYTNPKLLSLRDDPFHPEKPDSTSGTTERL